MRKRTPDSCWCSNGQAVSEARSRGVFSQPSLPAKPDPRASAPASDARGTSLAEFKMNAISDDTWMKATSSGLSRPKAARPMPTPSTPSVLAKFRKMVRRQRRAIRRISPNFEVSFPINTVSALSRATSAPDPMATPTAACGCAGFHPGRPLGLAILWLAAPCSHRIVARDPRNQGPADFLTRGFRCTHSAHMVQLV